jgi:hypothetical protein
MVSPSIYASGGLSQSSCLNVVECTSGGSTCEFEPEMRSTWLRKAFRYAAAFPIEADRFNALAVTQKSFRQVTPTPLSALWFTSPSMTTLLITSISTTTELDLPSKD